MLAPTLACVQTIKILWLVPELTRVKFRLRAGYADTSYMYRQLYFDHFTRSVYWTASIGALNFSESFCLQYSYLCVFYSFLEFLRRNEFWFVAHLQSKIGLCKTPRATQALASPHYADVKGILRGFVTFVKHSSRIPLRTSAWETTQALVCKWLSFQKKNIHHWKKISVVPCNAGEKNVTLFYAREIYSISTGLGNNFFTQSKSRIPPLKSQVVDP